MNKVQLFIACIVLGHASIATAAPNMLEVDFLNKPDARIGIYDGGVFVVQGENLLFGGSETHFSEIVKIIFKEDSTPIGNLNNRSKVSLQFDSPNLVLELKEASRVHAQLIDLRGRVTDVLEENFVKGIYVIPIGEKTKNVANGIFLLRTTINGSVSNRVVTVVGGL